MKSKNPAKLAQQADKLIASNRIEEAITVYSQLADACPDDVNVLMNFGSLCAQTGKIQQAADAFRRACRLTDSFGKQHEYLVNTQEMLGDFDAAIKTTGAFASLRNAPTDIELRLGTLYGKKGDFRKAIEHLTQHLSRSAGDANTHHMLASCHASLDDFLKAKQHYAQAIQISHGDYQLHNNYGALLQRAEEYDAAIDQYIKATGLAPDYAPGHYNLGSIYLLRCQFDLAVSSFEHCCKLTPENAQAWLGLGISQFSLNRYHQAAQTLQHVLSLAPQLTPAMINLALCNISLGEFDHAEALLLEARNLLPADPEVLCTLSQLYERQNRMDEARSLLAPLLNSDPTHPDVTLAFAASCSTDEERTRAIAMIEAAIADRRTTHAKRISLQYRAGKLQNKMQHYDEAFEAYRSANQLQGFRYDHAQRIKLRDDIIASWPADASLPTAKTTAPEPRPVFIVGMPRSGTTLIEQIIACHPQVCGAGELQYIDMISSRLREDTRPREASLQDYASQYMKLASDHIDDTCTVFSDKMPHNFQHLGLISALFPDSLIIHCRRNPVDTCLSIYLSEFNARHPYANSLDDLADFYNEFYLALMAHWDRAETVPVLHIDYEALVENQQAETRRLLEFIGVPWDEACMDFHNSGRNVVTPSYDQIRRPLYKDSVSRWRNYDSHIGTLVDKLGT